MRFGIPEYRVKQAVGESNTGRDAQLDTAVRELLAQISPK